VRAGRKLRCLSREHSRKCLSRLHRTGHVVARAGEIAETGPGVLAFGFELMFDGEKGAEHEVGGVGHGCGAPRCDAVLGLEAGREEFVDGNGRLKVGQAVGDGSGEVHGSARVLREKRDSGFGTSMRQRVPLIGEQGAETNFRLYPDRVGVNATRRAP
jgi:hypothetical protein